MSFKCLTLVTLSKNAFENLKSSHSSRVTTDLMLLKEMKRVDNEVEEEKNYLKRWKINYRIETKDF